MKKLAMTALASAVIGSGVVYMATDARPAMAYQGHHGGASYAYEHSSEGDESSEGMEGKRAFHPGMRHPEMAQRGPRDGFKGPGFRGGERGQMNPERMVRHLAVALDLSATQQDAIQKLVDKHSEKMGDQREERQAFHEKMRKLELSDKDYSKQAKKLIEEQSEQMAKVMIERAELNKAIYGELSETQKAQYQEMQSNGGMRRIGKNGMGPMHKGGDGFRPQFQPGMGAEPGAERSDMNAENEPG